MSAGSTRPRATIVVPGQPEVGALRATVASALAQTEQSVEVIVAGCSGDVLHALEELEDPRLTLVACDGAGSWASLNLGIALARADLIEMLPEPGALLDPSAIARQAAALDGHPSCALVLPLPARLALDSRPSSHPGTAATLLVGILEREVPSLGGVLFRAAALRAVGGVDATLRSAIADDLWLRILPAHHALFLRDHLIDLPAAPSLDDGALEDHVELRAERGFALVRAVSERGLEWWQETAAAATGLEKDSAAAWTALAKLLVRTGLAEAAPLARAAERRAAMRDLTTRGRGRPEEHGSDGAPEPGTSVAAPAIGTTSLPSDGERRDATDDAGKERAGVHELAALVRRAAHVLRSLRAGNRKLAATTPWLAAELDTTRKAGEEGLARAIRVFEKLRLRRRATEYSRRVVERSRGIVERWRPPRDSTAEPAPSTPVGAVAPGPRQTHWLILAAVPIDDIGGGQRSAQLARALAAAGMQVTYVARFPRAESTDLTLRLGGSDLEILDWDPSRLRRWLVGRDAMLRILVELPEEEVVDLARDARRHGARVIYDKIDNWAACSWASWYDAATERALVAGADDLVGSARLLTRQLARDERGAHLVPNAVDLGIFDAAAAGDPSPSPPTDLVRGAVTLLYAGSLWGDWFDWQLVAEVAAQRPAWSFNLIGDRPARLSNALPPNVHLLGLKAQTALPAYLAAADVCLIPFIPSPLVDAVSPLKVFEYLAMHRPVVAPPMPELNDMPYVFTAHGTAATLAAVERAAATPPPVAELERFVADNSWPARVRTLSALVAQPTISVIVLCYDNRDVIEHCVESLRRTRGDARYEIVVVDNGSRDGSLEVLRSYAARGDIALVQNPVNGCSSGRNLGVRACASEIVVFLDSDQRALFPGWLDPAIAILRNHAEVGAVGWNAGWFARGGGRGTTVDNLPDRGASALTPRGFRRDVAYLATSGLVVPRAVLQRTAGFDERLDPTCFEDTDLSFQIKGAGYALAYCPAIGLDHRPHTTTGALAAYGEVYRRNERYFVDKWQHRSEYFFDVPE